VEHLLLLAVQFSDLLFQSLVDFIKPLLSFQSRLEILFSTLGVDRLAVSLPPLAALVLALLATDFAWDSLIRAGTALPSVSAVSVVTHDLDSQQ